jgi:RNA 2',3'-cyclic 3'-phosphodiesterase
VTFPASVEGDERIRLFLALRLPDETLDALAAWQERELRDAGRLVPRGNVHLTLAFLGARPAGELPALVDVLARAAAETGAVELEVDRYRETRSAGMLVLRDRTGEATQLAARVGERLERLGLYRREQRPWLPHVTVLRYRSRPRLSPPLPELGTLVPSDAAAFLSRLHPGGARYEVLDTRSLGG